jgi:transmembrane sensor
MKNNPSTPSQPRGPHDWEALARYLSGESSPTESEQIARWLAEHPADSEVIRALDKAMTSLALQDASDVDVEGALSRIAAKRDEPVPLSPHKTQFHRPTRSPWSSVTLLAAAAVVIFAARAVLHQKGGANGSAAVGGTSSRTFATAVGKRDSLRLADGGRVILGPASQLIVAENYGQEVREVELHGEAYFDVVHDTKHPFVVRAGSATIRDVGTTFTVRSDGVAPVQVVVTSGSVSLHSGVGVDSSALLGAGDVGITRPDGRVAAHRGASTSPYLAWMRDSLVFREAPIAEVSSDLRRWYGVVLLVDDTSLARRHLTMTFAGDPLDRVLRVIGLELGADVVRHGDSAIVRPSSRSVRTQ